MEIRECQTVLKEVIGKRIVRFEFVEQAGASIPNLTKIVLEDGLCIRLLASDYDEIVIATVEDNSD